MLGELEHLQIKARLNVCIINQNLTCLFLIKIFPGFFYVVYYESIKRNLKTKYIWGVGVMKDYNLTLRNLRASHTIGDSVVFYYESRK